MSDFLEKDRRRDRDDEAWRSLGLPSAYPGEKRMPMISSLIDRERLGSSFCLTPSL